MMKKTYITTLITLGTLSLVPQTFAQTPTLTTRQEIKQEIKTLRESMRGNIVRLHKATITAIGTSNLTVSSQGKTYTVTISSSTNLRRHYFGKAILSEMTVNDLVDVIGTYTDDTATTINARLVRDVSIMKRHGVFFGTVSAISGNTITMTSVERGTQTVTVSSSTKYVNQKGVAVSLSDVKSGDKIRVAGVWDKANNTVTEVTNLKDFTLQ